MSLFRGGSVVQVFQVSVPANKGSVIWTVRAVQVSIGCKVNWVRKASLQRTIPGRLVEAVGAVHVRCRCQVHVKSVRTGSLLRTIPVWLVGSVDAVHVSVRCQVQVRSVWTVSLLRTIPGWLVGAVGAVHVSVRSQVQVRSFWTVSLWRGGGVTRG